MGQRHQFWLVARIGSRHRVLAAVHNQWAYATIPIKACWRLLQMVKNPHNQRLAKHELAAAALFDDNWWKKQRESVWEQQELDDVVPFPFLLTCLVLATSFDPRPSSAVNYSTKVHPLAIGTSLDETDNDGGFTVVDITDLDNPAYCFLHHDAQNKPITGKAYLRCYPESEGCYHPSLKAWSLIDGEVLRGLWPDVKWLSNQGSSTASDTATSNMSEKSGLETNIAKPSLWDMAFRKAIETVLDDADSVEVLDSVQHVPGFTNRLLQYLIDNAESAQRPGGVLLLQRAFTGQDLGTHCDLSHWPNLTDDDVLHVLEHAGSLDKVTTIDLSNNPNVIKASVENIVKLCPSLETIVAMNTPTLPLAELLRSLHDCGKKCQVLNTDRFRAPFAFADNVKAKPTEASIAEVPPTNDTTWSSSSYIAGLKTVTQILFYFYMGTAEADNEGGGDAAIRSPSNLPWAKTVEELKALKHGLWFGAYGQPSVRCIPVRDAMLDPGRATEWFPQIMQTVIHKHNIFNRMDGSTISPELSMAIAVGLKNAWRVSPLPTSTYVCTNIGCGCQAIPQCHPVDDQSWTMLIFHDTGPMGGHEPLAVGTVHYALVTRGPDDTLVVADLERFAKLTSGEGGIGPAVNDLITEMKAAGAADKESGRNRSLTMEELEHTMLSVDWAKLKSFQEEEAKEIVDKLIPAFEETRKRGTRGMVYNGIFLVEIKPELLRKGFCYSFTVALGMAEVNLRRKWAT